MRAVVPWEPGDAREAQPLPAEGPDCVAERRLSKSFPIPLQSLPVPRELEKGRVILKFEPSSITARFKR